jgi:hypothetical protein
MGFLDPSPLISIEIKGDRSKSCEGLTIFGPRPPEAYRLPKEPTIRFIFCIFCIILSMVWVHMFLLSLENDESSSYHLTSDLTTFFSLKKKES